MKRLSCVALAGLLLLLPSAPASASAIVYGNEAAFAAATSATLHPLPVGPGGTYINGVSVTTTDGELTLSATAFNLFSNWEAYPGAGDFLAGPDLAISGPENLNATVAFSADRYAFGFGIYEPGTNTSISGCNAPCVDSTFTITLLNNLVAVGSPFILSPSNDLAQFWGVHTDFAFDAVQIRETTGGIDNEIFGTFYTGITSVPEPSALLLFGAAFGFDRLRRYRRR